MIRLRWRRCRPSTPGEITALTGLLCEHPALATASLGDERMARTLLHVATDWPGHFPNSPDTVRVLIAAGADVNARFVGSHSETPLHWAASSDDVEVLEAFFDLGADIEAEGAVIGGGTPLDDATAFGPWNVARRLVERGAVAKLWAAAALGLLQQVKDAFEGPHRRQPSRSH